MKRFVLFAAMFLILLSLSVQAAIDWPNGTYANITFTDNNHINLTLTSSNITVVNSTGKYIAVMNSTNSVIGTANAIDLANCTVTNMYSGYTSCTNLIDDDLDAAAWQTSSVGTDSFQFSVRMDLGTTIYTPNISVFTCGDGSGPGSCNNGEFLILVSGNDVDYYPLWNFTNGAKAYGTHSWWNNTFPLQGFRYINLSQNRSASGLWMTELQIFPALFTANTSLYLAGVNGTSTIDQATLQFVDNQTSPTGTQCTYDFCDALGNNCQAATPRTAIDFSPDLTGLSVRVNYRTGDTKKTCAIKSVGFSFVLLNTGPVINNVQNNATVATTTGDLVNFSAAISSTSTLSHCWFEHNSTGTFVNGTKVPCSSVYNMNYTLQVTALPYIQVCGRFGANDTTNSITTSALSCFTVADKARPNVTGFTSNVSMAVINDKIVFWANATDNVNLSYFVFRINSTGTPVNNSPVLIGVPTTNITVNVTIPNIPGYNICAELDVNDTNNNWNTTRYCFTTPPLANFNITIYDRRNNTLINNFNATINGTTGIFTVVATSGVVRFSVNLTTYTIKINTTQGYGFTIFNYALNNHANISVNLSNLTIINRPLESLDSQTNIFSLAFRPDDFPQYENLNLVFNGTAYNATRTNTNEVVYFNYSLNPLSANNFSTLYTYYWNYSVLGVNRQSESYSLLVTRVLVTNCSPTDHPNNISINISFFNEETPSQLVNANLQAELHLFSNLRSVFYNATFNLARNESSYALCINPRNSSVRTDAIFSYTVDGGFTHRYYLQLANLSNSTIYINAFNYKTQSLTSDLKVTARYKNNYNPFKNIIATLQRKYISEGLWRTVQMDKSGDLGLMFFNIKEQDTDYRFIFVDENNSLLKTTEALKFVCPPDASGVHVCDITYLLNPNTAATIIPNPAIALTYNNATNIITVAWVDTSGLSITENLIVTKEKGTGTIVLCNSSLTGSSGSITCNASAHTGPVLVTVYTTTSDNRRSTFSKWIEVTQPALANLIGIKEGAWWSAAIVITVSVASLFHPLAAVIATVFGLVVVALIGLLSPVTISLVIIFAILATAIGLIIKGGRSG